MYSGVIFGLAVAVVLLTSIFKTVHLSTRVKSALAFVLSVGGGAFYAWQHYHGTFTTTNFVQAVAYVYAASQLVYGLIVKGSNLDNILGNGSAIQQVIAVLRWFTPAEKAAPLVEPTATVVNNSVVTTTTTGTTA
jgi:hypothetical protein